MVFPVIYMIAQSADFKVCLIQFDCKYRCICCWLWGSRFKILMFGNYLTFFINPFNKMVTVLRRC